MHLLISYLNNSGTLVCVETQVQIMPGRLGAFAAVGMESATELSVLGRHVLNFS